MVDCIIIHKLSFDRRDGQDKQQSSRDEPYNLPSDNVRPFKLIAHRNCFPKQIKCVDLRQLIVFQRTKYGVNNVNCLFFILIRQFGCRSIPFPGCPGKCRRGAAGKRAKVSGGEFARRRVHFEHLNSSKRFKKKKKN